MYYLCMSGLFLYLYNELRYYLCMSGLFLYSYNELATIAMSRTSALTASVANTAKRAFVIVGVGVAMGKVSPGI